MAAGKRVAQRSQRLRSGCGGDSLFSFSIPRPDNESEARPCVADALLSEGVGADGAGEMKCWPYDFLGGFDETEYLRWIVELTAFEQQRLLS